MIKRFNFSILLFGALISLLSITVHADFYLHSWDNRSLDKSYVRTQLLGSYYQTTGNINSLGLKEIPLGFKNYTRYQGDLNLDWGVAERLSLFGRFSWAYINLNSSLRASKVFGLSDQTLGLTLQAYKKHLGSAYSEKPPFKLDLQLQFDIPGYNKASSDQKLLPYLGDQTFDMTIGGFISFPIYYQENYVFGISGGTGYTRRNFGFSSALPWSADIKYIHHPKGLIASLGMIGIYSLKNDQYTNSNLSRSSAGTGGSLITGAVNPSYYSLKGMLGYKFKNKAELTASVIQTLGGISTPYGTDVLLGMTFLFDVTKKPDAVFQNPDDYGKTNMGFLRYSMDATVIRTNDRLNLVKINKGSQDGIEIGETFDIFNTKKNGETGVALTRCKVVNIKDHEAALEIREYFQDTWIEEGFIAKKLIQ